VNNLEQGSPALQSALSQVYAWDSCAARGKTGAHRKHHAKLQHQVLVFTGGFKLVCVCDDCLQGTHVEAKKSIEKAKQLSTDAASILSILKNSTSLSEETEWLMSRPLLRLLLWLVPEHILLPESPPGAASAAHVLPAEHGTIAANGGKQKEARARPDEDWKQGAAISFAHDVTTVSMSWMGTDHLSWCMLTFAFPPTCRLDWQRLLLWQQLRR
jgi:hypothetical protein